MTGFYYTGGHLGNNYSLPEADEIRLEEAARIGCVTSLPKQSGTRQ